MNTHKRKKTILQTHIINLTECLLINTVLHNATIANYRKNIAAFTEYR